MSAKRKFIEDVDEAVKVTLLNLFILVDKENFPYCLQLCKEPQGLAPARKKKIDPSTYNYTREDTMADPSSLRPPFFTLFSLNSSTHRHRSFD